MLTTSSERLIRSSYQDNVSLPDRTPIFSMRTENKTKT